MSIDELLSLIQATLESGRCPQCGVDIETNDTMTEYHCPNDTSHFELVVEFVQEGEAVRAWLNGTELPPAVASKIDW